MAGGLGWARWWLADPVKWRIVEWGGQGCSWLVRQQLVDPVVPYLCADKLGGTKGEQNRPCNPRAPVKGNKASNHRLKAPVGIVAVGETPSLIGEFVGETHRVPECTQTHPPRNQHQKGPLCLWVTREVTESQQRAEQAPLFPLGPLPYVQHHSTPTWVASPW